MVVQSSPAVCQAQSHRFGGAAAVAVSVVVEGLQEDQSSLALGCQLHLRAVLVELHQLQLLQLLQVATCMVAPQVLVLLQLQLQLVEVEMMEEEEVHQKNNHRTTHHRKHREPFGL